MCNLFIYANVLTPKLMVTPGQDQESLGDVPLAQATPARAQASLLITLRPAMCISPGPSSVCPASEPLHVLLPLPRMFWMYSLSGRYLYPLTLSLHLLGKAVPDPHLK